MIDVKQAISVAMDSLTHLYGNLSGLLVEEVSKSDDGNHWLITLGFASPLKVDTATMPAALGLGNVLRPQARLYKIVNVDARSGEFVSMKIREANPA
jgi:hypothetical protein